MPLHVIQAQSLPGRQGHCLLMFMASWVACLLAATKHLSACVSDSGIPTCILSQNVYAAGLKDNLEMASLSANTIVQLLELLAVWLVKAATPNYTFQPLLHRYLEMSTSVDAHGYDPALTKTFSRAAYAQPFAEQQASACTEFDVDWAHHAKPTEVCLHRLPPKHAEVLTLHDVTWQLYMYATRKQMTLTDLASSAVWDSQAQPGNNHVPFLISKQQLVCMHSCIMGLHVFVG